MVHPLQTKEWSDFRKEWGNEILENEYGVITLHKVPFTKLKIGIFEKGPLPTKKMVEDLKILGKKNNFIFLLCGLYDLFKNFKIKNVIGVDNQNFSLNLIFSR